ncbi:uncharacterized protein LOC135837469 isoform X2 [Planococcus citri]|uniref:uncharacterized protein LOC135837469 isoform X2 n=1 Tax=Planococcus citri TaxID=170843 RepID=UPI0031F7538C
MKISSLTELLFFFPVFSSRNKWFGFSTLLTAWTMFWIDESFGNYPYPLNITENTYTDGNYVITSVDIPAALFDVNILNPPDDVSNTLDRLSRAQICRKENLEKISTEVINMKLGESSFEELIYSGKLWSDKSGFIYYLFTFPEKVLLVTYPRRFGKSTIAQMVHLFARILDVSLPDEQQLEFLRSCYFKNSTIPIFEPNRKGPEPCTITDTINIVPSPLLSRETKFLENHMGQYPVIYMDFAPLKGKDDNQLREQMNDLISETFRQHAYLLDYFKSINDVLAETKFNYFLNAVNENENTLVGSIPFLAEKLSKYFHRKVLIIVDEYDTPFNVLLLPPYNYEGDKLGYWTNYYRNIMESWFKLKTHNYATKIFLTGIMRIQKISGLSDVNCISQKSILDKFNLNQFFGFSSDEVKTLLTLAGKPEYFAKHKELTKFSYKDLAKYYDGYHSMGSDANTLFTPHSVCSFLQFAELGPYWDGSGTIVPFVKLLRFENLLNTIGQLYETRPTPLSVDILDDIDEKGLMRIKEFVNNDSIETGFSDTDSNMVLGVLCQMGYITAVNDSFNAAKRTFLATIPNEEIRSTLFQRWYKNVVHPKMTNNIRNKTFVEDISAELNPYDEKKSSIKFQTDGLLAKIRSWITPIDKKIVESTVIEISKIYNSDNNIFLKTFLVCNIIIDVAKKVFLH